LLVVDGYEMLKQMVLFFSIGDESYAFVSKGHIKQNF